ncbi:MAG TPA: hypothetical protein VF068_15285, partial [Rubrobacter sp.]
MSEWMSYVGAIGLVLIGVVLYWLAILFTFALGTAAGDRVSKGYGLGYWKSGIVFALAYYFKANAVLTFWIAYILTRPWGLLSATSCHRSTPT